MTMAEHDVVQLGFALPLHGTSDDDDDSSRSDASESSSPRLGHESHRWSEWDGGKIGGRPSWLNPRDLPSPLRCRGPCDVDAKGGTPLRFVLQLYCPADDASGNKAAFHRSLYVFACPTCCSAKSMTDNEDHDGSAPSETHRLSRCIRVLRCQLPKLNDFYPPTGDGESDGEKWTKHMSEYWADSIKDEKLNLCAVCGQRSSGKCPKQKLWFCGSDHQREYLLASKKERQQGGDPKDGVPMKYLPSACHESELVVEEEPAAMGDEDDLGGENSKSEGSLFPSKDMTDADADLEQSDLNALTGNTSLARAATGVTDPMTLAFYARMAIGGRVNDVRDQCLRYCRWPEKSVGAPSEQDEIGPLWLSSDDLPPSRSTSQTISDFATPSFPPPCEYCGSPRAFEFQILPQMLHYLLHGAAGGDNKGHQRQVLTESERAVLLEAKSRIESGADLPKGFVERHDAAVARAREALLGVSTGVEGSGGGSTGGFKGGLDWGTIAVYTCVASCGDGGVRKGDSGSYRDEAAWMQPPLD